MYNGAACELSSGAPMLAGVHACRRGNVAPGKAVAVLGAGPIGAFRSPSAPLSCNMPTCWPAAQLCSDTPLLLALVCKLPAATSLWTASVYA